MTDSTRWIRKGNDFVSKEMFPHSLQLSLPLFNPGFNELIKSHDIQHFEVKINGKLKRSWHAHLDKLSGKKTLIVPKFFENAPEEIKLALINWASLPFTKHGSTREKRRTLEKFINDYIQSNCAVPSRKSRLDPESLENSTTGCAFDLREIFDSVNRKYFSGEIKSLVRWGTPFSMTSYQTTRLTRDHARVNLITIAGVYDHPDVPRYAIESVMFHEMLHIKIPPFKVNGRNVIHGPDFKNAERNFEYYQMWTEWERRNIREILKKKKRQSGRRGFFKF
jgi:hypothetical protein